MIDLEILDLNTQPCHLLHFPLKPKLHDLSGVPEKAQASGLCNWSRQWILSYPFLILSK